MARLADLSYGKLTALLTKLGNAGLSAQLAEKLAREPGLIRRVVDLISTYPEPSEWSLVRYVKLTTTDWQDIAPNVRAKLSDGPGGTMTFQVWDDGWSVSYGTAISIDWYEFRTGLQLRRSREYPGLTEFRYKV